MTHVPERPNVLHEVALSYAREDRTYVADIAHRLVAKGIKPFYDEYSLAESWGQDLYVYLDEVYRKEARFAVIFISRYYVTKPWTAHERQSAQARALIEREPYILPVRLDDSELPGLRPTVGYVDARVVSKDQLVSLILEKLRGPTAAPRAAPLGVPRTADQEHRLLVERPAGWEYLLFAGVLAQGKDALDGKWHDHQVAYARPQGQLLDDSQSQALLSSAFDEAQVYIGNLNRLLDQRFQESAFGRPGEPGDADRIRHIGVRIVGMYEDFLDWSARLRGAQVSTRFRRATLLAASFMDLPLKQLREFIDRCVVEIDQVPTLLHNNTGNPILIDLHLVLSIDPQNVREFNREMKRARRGRH